MFRTNLIDITKYQELAGKKLEGIMSINKWQDFWQTEKIKISHELPEYYLIYFLLVDLLNFKKTGESKVLRPMWIDIERSILAVKMTIT